MAEFGPATEQIVLANVIISDDVDRSRFPNCLLGGRAIFSGGDWSGWLPSPSQFLNAPLGMGSRSRAPFLQPSD